MKALLLIPALIIYTLICAFVIHLISDRLNRQKRRATYLGERRVRNTK